MTAFTPQTLAGGVAAMLPEVTALTERERLYAGEQAADVIGCGADVLWAPPHIQRKAELKPDEVFRGITAGIAILAHRPGGVTFGGMHWCTTEHGDCPGLGEWTIPASSMTRTARGAVFTPRSLAEEVCDDEFWSALCCKPGPLQTSERDRWRLISSSGLLKLTIGDIAVGSGIFLLVACRALADLLVRIWFAEAGHPMQELPPYNPMTTAARRQVMRCLHGIDIDPLSVELSRLALALLAPLSPVDLTSHIVCGDSLLGLSTEQQLIYGHLDPARNKLGPIVDPDLVRLAMQHRKYVSEEKVA